MLCHFFIEAENSSMGYMEMKRAYAELMEEVQCLRQKSEFSKAEHLEVINQLAEEITEQKVSTIMYFSRVFDNLTHLQRLNAQVKGEIKHYQGLLINILLFFYCFSAQSDCLSAKSKQLEALEHSLEAIKFEK